MHPLVLGTAGHVDHGKTSLVKALTGVDTDRLKEEQERGITIELGFARLPLPDGAEVALVDVPGHERFVRTMVAGAAGLDAVLLVVAADEGVMPQTREHLAICSLLGVRAGLVALTKVDLLNDDPGLRTVAERELREALAGTVLAAAPIVPCSTRSGVGLDRLRNELARLVSTLPARAADGWPRLPIDRVFALRGFGTVVTGTLWSGCIRVGDELSAQPGGQAASERMKVRGLHVHGQPVSEVRAGQRAAVNLAVPRELLTRGQTLIAPGSLPPCTVCAIELHYLPSVRTPLKRRSELLLHAGTTFRLSSLQLLDCSELAPGGRALAELRVPRDKPLLLMPGDRVVLRGFSTQEGQGNTVGGGLVLRCGERRRKVRDQAKDQNRDQAKDQADHQAPSEAQSQALAALWARQSALSRLLSGPASPHTPLAIAELIQLAVSEAGLHGAALVDLRRQIPAGLPSLQLALTKRLSTGELVVCHGAGSERGPDAASDVLYVDAAAQRHLQELAESCLREFHQREPTTPGLSPETLRSQLQRRARGMRPAVLAHALHELALRRRLIHEGSLVRLAEHRVQRDTTQDGIEAQILALYQQTGLAPPRQDELLPLLQARGLQPLPAAWLVAKTVEGLVRSGALVRIKDLHFLRAHLDVLRGRLVAYLQQHRELAPSVWKEMVGQSRKFSIPLAEYFDAEKVTLRVGDLRRLRTAPRVE